MNRLFFFLIVLFTGLFFDGLDIFKICILSSAFHEIGHIIAYRFFIGKWPEISVSVFGFKMKNNVSHSKYFIYIVFAGPFVNLIIVITSLFMLNNQVTFSRYIWLYVNIIIFIINVLPVYFLDGGQVLYSLNPFYQRNYRFLSGLTLFLLCVMVYIFTGVKISILLFIIYFAINILNDI